MNDGIVRIPATHSAIGLDLSLSATGFCCLSDGGIRVETIKTTPSTCPNDLARFRHISDQVMRRIADVPAMVCVEDVFIPHQAARVGQAINLAKLAAVARLALYERGIPFCVVTPQQLKKFVTGSGSGDKGIIIREVYKKWGVDCKDDNQADAAVLAHLAEAVWLKISGRSEFDKLLAYQRDVVEKVVKERPFYNVDAGKPEP